MMDYARQVLCAELTNVDERTIQQLLSYLTLLHKWNQAYNLTAIRDVNEMVFRHILDSLAVLPFLHGQHILDVGTGAGLPGIPLAIVNPTQQITLLDSNGKKTRILQEVKRSLGLTNINIKQMRVESYHSTQGFDTIISRAFSRLDQLLKLTKHLIAKDGIWVAMKSADLEEELNMIDSPYQIKNYTVPNVPGMRCCVIVNSRLGLGP